MSSSESESNEIQYMILLSNNLDKLHSFHNEEKEKILQTLHELIVSMKEINKTSINPYESKSISYYFNKFMPIVIRNLLKDPVFKHTSRSKETILSIFKILLSDLSESIQQLALFPCVNHIQTSQTTQIPYNLSVFPCFYEAISEIFDWEKTFFRSEIDCFDLFFNHFLDFLSKSLQKWTDSISEGEQIDCLYIDKSKTLYKTDVGAWQRGVIIEINRIDDYLKVIFEFNKDIRLYNLSSNQIFPCGTFTKNDFSWREQLKENDEIDVLDFKSWYKCTVIERKGKNVKYAQRVYTEKGKLKDMNGRNYIGYSEVCDKDLCVFDYKLRRPGEFSKEIINYEAFTYYPNDMKEFNEIETILPFRKPDASQVNNESEFTIENFLSSNSFIDKYIYVVPRKTDKFIDICLFDLMNFFIKSDSLKNILLALKALSSLCSYDNFNLFSKIIIFLSAFFHRSFSKLYCKSFVDESMKYMISLSKMEKRNFNRLKIENSIKRLREILMKSVFENDANWIYERFTLEFGVMSIESKVLDVKILGMRMIISSIESMIVNKYMNNIQSHLPIEFIYEKINESQVFKRILKANDTHFEVIHLAGELIKVLSMKKLLTNEDLKYLYILAKESVEKDIIKEVYNIIKSNCHFFGNDQLFFMIDLIINRLSQDKDVTITMTENDINLLITLYNLITGTSTSQASIILSFFLDIILSSYELTKRKEAIEDLSILLKIENEFMVILSSWDMRENFQSYINRICSVIISNTRKDEDLKYDLFEIYSFLFRILNKLYNKILNSISQGCLLNYIFNSCDLYSKFIQILSEYHRKSRIFLLKTEKTVFSQEETEKSLLPQLTYLSHTQVIERIIKTFDFFFKNRLDFVNNFQSPTSEIDILFLLFKYLVQERISIKDCYYYITLVNDYITSLRNKEYLINNEKEFSFLFSSLLDKLSVFDLRNEFSHNEISVIEESVWNMFYWLNRNSISQLDHVFNSNNSSNKYNGISNTGEIVYSCERYKKKDLIMLIKYNKDKPIDLNLQSIHAFWSIIINLTSEDSILVERLINLYTNNSFTSEVKAHLWESFIKTCVSFLSLFKNEVKKVKMTLSLMTFLIEESEVYGTAGVSPHGKGSFSEGSMLLLNYYVHISSRYDKDSNIKVSSSLTFWELKSILSQRLNIQPCLLEVQLQSSKSQSSLTNKHNSKTLHELGIKNEEMLFVSLNKDMLNSIPKVSLMIDHEMNPLFLNVLHEIFDAFRRKDKEIMEFNEVKSFFEAINSYNTYNIDDKIKAFIVSNGNGEYLTREDFVLFYYKSIVNLDKAMVVWDNLTDLGYRNDLKRLDSPIETLVFSKEQMPRHVISAKNEYFDTIYSIEDEIDNDNDKEDMSFIIKKFLDVIATNQSIYSQILQIKQNDYESLLSFHNKHINYILSIIYSICHDVILTSNCFSSHENDVSFLSKREWIERFAFSEGVSFLIKLIFGCDLKKRKNQKIALLSLKSLRLIVVFDLKHKLNQGMLSETYSSSSKEESLTMISSVNQLFLFENCSFSELYSEESEAEKTISLFIKRMIDESSKLESEEKGFFENKLRKTRNNSSNEGFIEYNHLFSCLIEYILRIKQKEFITNDEKNIVSYSISIIFGLLMTNIVNLQETSNENQLNLSIILSDILIPYKQTTFNRLSLNKPTILRDLKFISVVLVLKNNVFIVDFLLNELVIKTLQNEDDVTSKGNSIVYFLLEILINLYFLPQTRSFLQSKESLRKAFVLLKKKYSHEQLKYVSEEELYGLLRIYYRVLYLYNTSEEEERNDIAHVSSILSVDFICSVVLYISNHIILNSVDNEDSSSSSLLFIKRLSTVEIIYDFLSEFLDITHVEFSPIDYLLSNTRLQKILSYLSLSNTVNNDYVSSYNPFNDKKKRFVGLKNPSSICYINSIIQQLYHVPSFKYSILLCKDNKPINNKQVNDVFIDDNLLHQTQKLFTYLDLSIKQDTSILDFCYSFKDYDNNPTDIRIQQDSQEFLSRYLDKIEECMKQTEYESIVKSLFLGKVCSQMICTGGCGTVKNTYEDFPYLSLEIKQMTKLQQSLQSLISEERIEYSCEVCKQKVDLIKKMSLFSLPHVLFIHLKRFDYNYQSFQIDKLNSRLDFPLEINLKEYCIGESSYYKESYYEYRLVGVNIHIGTASAGHYKSVILSREDENWYLINDSHISNYDIKNLENDCFGGVVFNSNEEHCYNKEMRENSQSAYMLVYERKSLDCEYTTVSRLSNNDNDNDNEILMDIDIDTNTNTDNITNTSTQLNKDNNKEIKYFFYKSILNQTKDIHKIYNPQYFSIINEENIKFLNDRMVFNEYFIYFYDSLVRNCSSNESFLQIFSLFFDVVIKSHFKSNTNQILIRLSEKLAFLLIRNESLYETLLSQVIFKSSKRKDFILNEVLLSNEYNSIYSIFIILISTGFNQDFACQDKNCLLLLESILSIMTTYKSNEIFKNSHRLCFIGYFKLIREISELDGVQYKSLFDYLFNNGIINKTVDFILNLDSSSSKSTNSSCSSNIFTALANFTLLAYPIITYSNHNLMFELNSKGISYRYHLSNKDIEALENKQLYIKSLSLSSSSSFSKMISHCMWNNIDFTKKKLFTILDFLNDGYDPCLIKNGLDLLNFILDINDDYQPIRLEWILGIPEINTKYLNSYASLPNTSKSKYEKVVKFTSPLLYNTNNESLLSLITKKYQSLGDYLHIINYFICIILRNSHSLFLNYLLNMPHPYLLTNRNGLIEYIYLECENEIKRISKLYNNTQQQVVTDYQALKIRLDQLISEVEYSKNNENNACFINKSYLNLNFSITLNEYSIVKETIHDITPIEITSKGLEIRVLRVSYTLNRSVNLVEKSKKSNNHDDFNEYSLYNNKNSSSDENEEDFVGKTNKTKKNQVNHHGNYYAIYNEDKLYSQIINDMNKSNQNEYIREYEHFIIDDKYIEDNIYNSFIRYIVFNTSNSKEIKVNLEFTCENTINTHIYLPYSSFTYEIKPNSLSNIHSFLSSNLTPIAYESIRLVFLEETFLDNNMLQLPAAPNDNELSFDNLNLNNNNNDGNNGETFDMACTFCGYSNVINNYSNFECSNCSSPLFG